MLLAVTLATGYRGVSASGRSLGESGSIGHAPAIDNEGFVDVCGDDVSRRSAP